MSITPAVKAILDKYESDNPGTKANLARILMQGRLGGTGKMIILPVDQGFEHGPGAQLRDQPAGLRSALPLPAGDRRRPQRLCGAARRARGGRGHLRRPDPDHPQDQQLEQLGDAQGPGGDRRRRRRAAARLLGDRLHHLSRLRRQYRADRGDPRAFGRGQVGRHRHRDLGLSARRRHLKEGELALDVTAYGAHMAALLGAHIIKVKLPSAHIEQTDAQEGL